MRYGSVCSGIESATVAWGALGWEPMFFSEIEPFPCSRLAHHYPNVPNWGDMTKFQEWPGATIDVLVGGTPCQSFSVAGLRKGLADPRGNLALTFLAIADKYRPDWVVWENVPGVLSSAGGRDFGSFVGGVAELGYGWAYRVLDAQFFGVAQRRRRVFVVGSSRGWGAAAAVLFERESLSGHPAPSREAREGIANSLTERPDRGGGNSEGQRLIVIAHSLKADGFDASEDGTGRGTPLVPHVVGTLSDGAHNGGGSTVRTPTQDELSRCLNAGGMGRQDWETETLVIHKPDDPCHPLAAGGHPPAIAGMQVRRLTPRECERLQGFPDDYTLVPHRGKPAADGPRYKALGNSMAVPCMRWIGERIAMVEQLTASTVSAGQETHRG